MDVQIRCVCSPKDEEPRHNGNTVTLRDTLDPRAARAIRYDIKALYFGGNEPSNGDIMSVLIEDALIYGIESWTLVDEAGKPLEVSKRSITDRILSSYEADRIGDEAVPLYQVSVIDPLVAQVSTSSPPTPTKGSTSATTSGSSKPPKPSKQSSTSITRTVGTETTSLSLVGVGNSSQNSESAA